MAASYVRCNSYADEAGENEWEAALDATANELLQCGGIETPPVDVFQLAKALQMTVVMDHRQFVRGRQKQMGGQPVILLRPEKRPERLQWALAHEIGETVAWRVIEQLAGCNVPPAGLREEIANRLAARLLLPRHWFFPEAERLDFHLYELKDRFRTASHAMIALRFLDLPRPAAIWMIDQGRLKYRKSNVRHENNELSSREKESLREAHRRGVPALCEGPAASLRVWPVHEPGWKREIAHWLFTPAS